MITVFLADDHALIREGMRRIVSHEEDIKVIGESGTAKEAIHFVRDQGCDVLVLDINLPDKDGLDALKDIKIFKPDQAVLILSMHPEERYATRAFRSGAAGYVAKDTAADEIVSAIRKVASGGKYVSPSLAEKLATELDDLVKKTPVEQLSDREFQVMQLMAKGKSQAEIADELALSPTTVNTYRRRILDKLNLKTNAELIHFAITNKLLE